MVEENGQWNMAGYERLEDTPLKTHSDMINYIRSVGFVPLFQNEIPGFSIEEHSFKYGWWGEQADIDPWALRETVAGMDDIAYGKLFFGKAGFIAKEYLPYFARIRRDGYDFDSRYEDGLASRRCKMLMDMFEEHEMLPSHKLKEFAGFGKGKEKGYDSTLSLLQMQTYLTVSGFSRKISKKGEEYGWSIAEYMRMEHKFGEDFIRNGYALSMDEAVLHVQENLTKRFGEIPDKLRKKIIFG